MPSTSFYIRKAVAFIAIVFSSAIAGAWIASVIKIFLGQIEYPVPPLYVVFPVLICMAFLSVLVHEGGHVLGGKLASFEFVLLIVGPLKIFRSGKRLALGYNKWIQMGGGLALSVPKDRKATMGDLFIYTAGGPLASLVLSGIFTALGSYLYSTPIDHALQGEAIYFVIFGALFNGGIALITLLPVPTNGIENDGKLLLDLISGGSKAEVKQLGQQLSTEAMQGIRPNLWGQDDVQRLLLLTTREDGKYAIMARLTAFYHFLDREELVSAGTCIEWIKKRIKDSPSHMRPALQLEVNYFEARYNPEATINQEDLPDAKGGTAKRGFIEKHTAARVHAAMLYRLGEYDHARIIALEGIRLSEHDVLQAGIAIAEAAWMQSIIAECPPQIESSDALKN